MWSEKCKSVNSRMVIKKSQTNVLPPIFKSLWWLQGTMECSPDGLGNVVPMVNVVFMANVVPNNK